MKNIIDQITECYQAKSQWQIRPLEYSTVSKTFRYDKESNVLERRLKSGKWKKVEHMSANQAHGYHVVKFNGEIIRTHRLLYCLANECDLDNSLVINHLDEVRSNNHHSNLELVSQRDNTIYSSDSSTGTTCVFPRSRGTSYQFQKRVGQIFLTYTTKNLANLELISNEFDKLLAGVDNNLMELLPDVVIKRWDKQLKNELNKVQTKEAA